MHESPEPSPNLGGSFRGEFQEGEEYEEEEEGEEEEEEFEEEGEEGEEGEEEEEEDEAAVYLAMVRARRRKGVPRTNLERRIEVIEV
jgi:hypothetical protein